MKIFERRIGMAILKLFMNVGLIFTATAALPVDADSSNDTHVINYRLPDNVAPMHYNIKLIPYIEEGNFTFDGESAINITIRHVTQNLSLHTLELTIDDAATSLFDKDGIVHMPTTYSYDFITHILVLYFDHELSPGNYTLKMRYVGILNDDLHGFFRVSYVNEEGNLEWLAASHFEATWARQAFPCWDEPALKATFDISIKHHRNYTALSNMPIRKQSDDGNENGMVWTYFHTTPIMSTYLVAFVVADYVRVPNKDGTVNMWCRSTLAPYTKFAQEVAQKSGQLLTEYTNSTDKVPKMDHVAVPKFAAGAMENWGLIIYVEKSFAYNDKIDTISTKQDIAVTAAHEMAHQWFGNVISPLWWSHVWLNEGFASFFEEYILNQIFQDWRVMEYFVVTTQQTALHIDIARNMKPITFEVSSPKEIESLFSYSTYGKAPAILRMLQHIITDEIFRKGIIKYLHKHQFNSATSDDLWNALQTVLDESDVPHNAYRLKEVMDTWIKQRHFPIVHVNRNNDTNQIILTQEHFRPESEDKHVDNDRWWIPLTFATQTNPDFSNTLPTHWLTPQDQNITIDGIDPNDWIIVNLQQMGYYRVNYDSSNWQKIANYLKSENYTKIHVLNRAQIIDDAYHFMAANQLNILTFLDLISYLSQERDFVAWFPMFEILEITEDFYKYPETALLKSYLIEILDGLIKNVGYEENPDEDDLTKLQRTKALKWACTLGHSECKRMATVKLNEHFENPITHKVSPNLREWTYCYGLMEANASTWNKLLSVYINKSNKKALKYLACSENPDIIIN
ncbi:puromycin-sensitive aminopeptidase-like protein, partial [Camponotus floridanus]|uniref:puromycin-sensitive aminopeptidase-like protein n=1 Tax=Camponotus floridanus TaxID=104421 RepID=UPI000DC67EBD